MNKDKRFLRDAQIHADYLSSCAKVTVGALIHDSEGYPMSFGANRTIPHTCSGIDRCQIDGHCVSTIHAEIDAIISAQRDLGGCTIYVTRYPCEGCARAIVRAGITKVVYCRPQPISEVTNDIFFLNDIEVVHYPEIGE